MKILTKTTTTKNIMDDRSCVSNEEEKILINKFKGDVYKLFKEKKCIFND